ncbi:hypothetical protein KDD93_00245 [Campylobacter sp. faydin G-24]|uniref:Uncharacterized protein n=1 Tax=Campylobacter anatolicus TaxID=2829105 RepID=A0ABS5HFP4_9BACT|nr:hypothetical protein [Campylobacter anatolicus]MBR8462562.1 hypothetical protein [Campylobacter anatolicus]MBR8463005.1 hypothetical protein [Campylobacter anatolicus]MBR8465673.1 hypothetical protein [Campylobacter anatolicus]
MSELSEKIKDKFELDRDEKAKALMQCQADKGLNSCFKCEALFECETRKNFVDATYNAMSKGSTGGFDF